MANANIGADGQPRKPTIIYVLIDPRDGRPRYVGKTESPLRIRLAGHICESGRRRDRKARWIRGLTRAGLKPVISELEVVPAEADWAAAEIRHIASHRDMYPDLLNLADGGEGPSGVDRGPEWRAALRASFKDNPRRAEGVKLAAEKNRGRKQTPDEIARRSAALRGRKLSPEQCEFISKLHKGRKRPAESVARIAEKLRGRKQAAETNEKRRATMLTQSDAQSDRLRSNWQRPEFRARMTATRKGIPKSPEFVAKMANGIKTTWADPEIRSKRLAAMAEAQAKPEYRAAQREIMRRKWQDPEFRQMMMSARKK